MPLIGFLIENEQLSFEQALDKALRGETEYGYPVLAAIVAAVRDKKRPPPEAGISASQFQGCLRKVVLEPREDYYDTPQSQYWLVRGSWTHATIEAAITALPDYQRGLYTQEERLFTSLEVLDKETGEMVSFPTHGQYDLLYRPPTDAEQYDDPRLADLPGYPILYDHKTTKFAPTKKQGPKADHIWQTSIYRWLLETAGRTPVPSEVRINYLDPAGVIQFRATMMDAATVEHYLRARLAPLLESRRRQRLPERVGPSGRWQCGDNRAGQSYCPFTARCWPEGTYADAEPDGLADYVVPS